MYLKKLCPKCNTIIDITERYCPKHQAEFEAKQKEHQKQYDKAVRYKRDKQYHDFYNSPEWQLVKQYIRNKYKGLCLWSYYIEHKIVMADEYHHITPLKNDWNKRLDVDNIIPLSANMHYNMRELYKTDKEGTMKKLHELKDRWDKEMGA